MSGFGSPSSRELRRFGLAFGSVLTLIGSLMLWRGRVAGPWILGVAAIVVLLAAAAPRALWPIERIMAAALRALMVVVTYVVLIVAYVLVITPMALLLRAMGKDILNKRFPTELSSYWVPVETDGPHSRPDKPY